MEKSEEKKSSYTSRLTSLFWWLPIGTVPEITVEELAKGLKRKRKIPQVLDVRTYKEWKEGHITGAVNIPLAELKPRIHDLPFKPNKVIAVICFSTTRSKPAVRLLMNHGYENAVQLAGGMRQWVRRGLAVEREV